MKAKIPKTPAAAPIASPLASFFAFSVTSALASSISSRISAVTRSETSVTVVAMISGLPLSGGKTPQDHRGQQPAGERSSDQGLGPLRGQRLEIGHGRLGGLPRV